MVRRGRRTRNSGPERLDGADAEAGTSGDLGIVIITCDENWIGLKSEEKNGGSGGARTRNLCRDRAAL